MSALIMLDYRLKSFKSMVRCNIHLVFILGLYTLSIVDCRSLFVAVEGV